MVETTQKVATYDNCITCEEVEGNAFQTSINAKKHVEQVRSECLDLYVVIPGLREQWVISSTNFI